MLISAECLHGLTSRGRVPREPGRHATIPYSENAGTKRTKTNFRETTNRASANRWQRSSFQRRARRFVPSAPATEPRTRQQERSGQTPRKSIQGERQPPTPTGPSPFRSSSREQDRAAQPKRSSHSTRVWRRRSPTRPAEETRTTIRQRCQWLQQRSIRKDYPASHATGSVNDARRP